MVADNANHVVNEEWLKIPVSAQRLPIAVTRITDWLVGRFKDDGLEVIA
jgi:hypothetical protein